MKVPIPSQTPLMQVPVPGLQRPIGIGDVIANITKAVGVKPCSPCQRRRVMLNKLFGFDPKGSQE